MDRFTKDHGVVLSRLTTGDCAAAAARAAAANLIFRIDFEDVPITHSSGSRTILVSKVSENCNNDSSEYYSVMEGGTAPDIREKAEIHATVSRIHDLSILNDKVIIDSRNGNLFLTGGEGIGTVQASGNGMIAGEAHIEKDARKLIFDAVMDVCDASDGAQLLLITISCPQGMMIAASNTMGQAVFTGGIPIMGEYGKTPRVHQRDITHSIRNQIMRQIGYGVKSILVAPGNYCADKIRETIHVPLTTAVRCYNFPGYAIDMASEEGIENLLLVGNVGKLVKLAAGIMNTNSYASDGRREIFASHTALVGGTASQVRTVMKCTTCEEILALLDAWGLRDRVMSSIMTAIHDSVRRRSNGKIRFGVALFSEEFGLLGQTIDTRNVLVKVSQDQFALSHKVK
ncbi:cobalt-precorrin-5B (C(1))-methyltransferase CbiD [Butyrivibrio proteoclasticus]|uniref:cobalt-precorrin-5B (C(1))-methyltransferase CbiD n=1 Tax=Butyrivibrio proteoclasticus TaxID=43305 RepID=UPI00047A3329|nr:cobalt-precorrin-5B (C(1))-methyltransferase CbiD [Butyrivibrio proteoclasticus]